MRARTSAAALAGVLLVAGGCGGGGSKSPHHHVQLTPFEQHGRTLFISTCGVCHELADAGTSGIAGPDLDQPWTASHVRKVIADGLGQMPARLLNGTAAAAVAAYVAAAGSG